MKRTFAVILLNASVILSLMVMPCVFAQTPGQTTQTTTSTQTAAPTPATGMQKGERGEHRERHPELHRALRKLRAAKEDLEKASHDYAGHRVKAIQAIDQALEELKQALASDKK
jgi:hypothetical protein